MGGFHPKHQEAILTIRMLTYVHFACLFITSSFYHRCRHFFFKRYFKFSVQMWSQSCAPHIFFLIPYYHHLLFFLIPYYHHLLLPSTEWQLGEMNNEWTQSLFRDHYNFHKDINYKFLATRKAKLNNHVKSALGRWMNKPLWNKNKKRKQHQNKKNDQNIDVRKWDQIVTII